MAVTIKKSRTLGVLSLTPLIDVVFLLLIFFLVTTRFAEEEREMDVVLPEASAAKPMIVEPKQLFINIDQAGKYYVSGAELNPDQLETALLQAWTNNPTGQEVIIRGDKDAAWQHIALAMNLCNKANIRDYKVATAE